MLLTCLMIVLQMSIDDFISSKKLKSDSMADPLRETGEDSSLPYGFFFQVLYTFMLL